MAGTVWSWATGRRRKNRVAVRLRAGRSNIHMAWHEGGREIERSLGHGDRRRAMEQARAKAAEIHPGPWQDPKKLVTIRADLMRVARMAGAPQGFAPPLSRYRSHGRFSVAVVRGAPYGYWASGHPKAQWGEAVETLGLRVYAEYRNGTRARVAADVRRVAIGLGRPRHMPPRGRYEKLGSWAPMTVLKHLGVRTWTEAAETLALQPNRKPPYLRQMDQRRSA